MAHDLPPPSLEIIISTFAAQAAVALGQVPNPVTNKTAEDLVEAKFAIDLLQVLEEKTKGHRTDAEDKLLGDALYRLRLIFIDKKG